MGYYITPDGNYYEGTHVAEGSIAVPQRPGPYFVWRGEWVNAGQPKDERIAHVLATQGKGRDRTTIQLVIEFVELVVAPKYAELQGVSVEIAKQELYARNKTYRESKNCEAAILAIETEPT